MLIDTTWPRFLLVVLAGFLVVNVIFACLYLMIGIENLKGLESDMGAFANAFFFSVHTLTTVGYGNVYPEGAWANTISSLEAATGLMVFAIATGLLYGRFSRPSARIVYSKNAIIAPYQDGTSLQFRVTNARRNVLMNMEARVLLMTVDSSRRRAEAQFHRPAARAARHLFLRADLDHRASHRFRQSVLRKDARRPGQAVGGDIDSDSGIRRHVQPGGPLAVFLPARRVRLGREVYPAFKVDPKGDLVVEVDRIDELKLMG